MYAYYRTLQRFAARLEYGHTSVNFPHGSATEYADFPEVQLQEAGHRAVVSDTAAGLKNDIPIGSEILSVNGVSTEAYLHAHVLPYLSTGREDILWLSDVRGGNRSGEGLLAGPQGSRVRVGIETPDGKRRTVTLTRNRAANDGRTKRSFGEKVRQPFEVNTSENRIVLVRLNSFDDERW